MPKAPATLDQFIEQIDRISMEKASSDRLASIDPNMPHVSPGYYSGRLQCVFASIQKSRPAISTIMPSGKAWHGTQLPDGWADAAVLLPRTRPDAAKVRGSLLHMASMVRLRPKWVGWLMASGADPLKFWPSTGNCALGQMAYSGDHASVRVVRRAGFDLSLRLLAEHIPDLRGGTDRLVGTTLLHRMVNRIGSRQPAHMQVLSELLRGGLSLQDVSASGETPIDFCTDPSLRAHLEQYLAVQSRKGLRQATAEPVPAPAGSSPRRI